LNKILEFPLRVFEGHDISEKMIRNRIDSLNKKDLIRKYDSKNNRIFIRPKESLVLNFQHITDFLL
jgi:hypothetical protein